MQSSSRLPKPSSSRPSSSRPTISRPISQPRPHISSNTSSSSLPASFSSTAAKESFLPSTSLPYLDHTPRTSSLTALPTLASRRNLSVSNLATPQSRPNSSTLEPRPHSFPPQKKRQTPQPSRLPPRVSQDPSNPTLDPFKIHASRVLRPSASSQRDSFASSISTSSLPPPPRSSSLTSPLSPPLPSPPLKRYSTNPTSPLPSLRRTATVRSATRHSTSTRVVRGPSSRRKPSISGTESFLMARTGSSSSSSSAMGSIYSQDSRRGGGVLLEEVESSSPQSKELINHWKAFVQLGSSPLIDQVPPTSPPSLKPSQHRRRRRSSVSTPSKPLFSPSSFLPSPALERAPSILSISSTPRELSRTLPQTNHHLHTRIPSYPPSSVSLDSQGMTRVDSEVLLTRLTLKRLGSTGFEGDALDKLGRGERDGGEWEDLREVERGILEEEEEVESVEDWADRYRDSFDGSWDQKEEEIKQVVPVSPPSPTYSCASSSSSNSSGRSGDSSRAWKWNPSKVTSSALLPSSTSTSTMSSSTSIGTLSRNWSKSTLMEELEKEVGRLSRDFDAVDRDYTEYDEGGEQEGENYVCALDLIFEDSTDEEEEEEAEVEVPVRRGGAPLRPLQASQSTGVSRLPRLKPSTSTTSLRQPVAMRGDTPPVPSVPSGFVSRMVKPGSVVKKFEGVGVGRGARAGWV